MFSSRHGKNSLVSHDINCLKAVGLWLFFISLNYGGYVLVSRIKSFVLGLSHNEYGSSFCTSLFRPESGAEGRETRRHLSGAEKRAGVRRGSVICACARLLGWC